MGHDNSELEAAIRAARAAGEILRQGYGRAHEVQLKGPIDPVTEYDRASEACIMAILAEATPGCGFLTEESAPVAGGSGLRWVIDPLDGTVNYAHGGPHFGVSIALERDGALQVGVVYDPLRDELFAAVACGRSDAHLERSLLPYDVAAGILLVREAGGIATDFAGGPERLYYGEIVAANPVLHAEMLTYLRTRPRQH